MRRFLWLHHPVSRWRGVRTTPDRRHVPVPITLAPPRSAKRDFEYVRDNDLFLTHALVTPRIDRSEVRGAVGRVPPMAMFAVPVEKPGLRLISRRPYDDGTRNTFDHPLSAHFEEADSLVVSVEVLVPRGRVFLHGKADLANAMHLETNLRRHSGHQTGARAPERDLGPECPGTAGQSGDTGGGYRK